MLRAKRITPPSENSFASDRISGVIAVPGKDGITVYGSIQCPFYVEKALKVMLGPSYGVRVVQTETGGGFGGKEEYPSMLACHAALLALNYQGRLPGGDAQKSRLRSVST